MLAISFTKTICQPVALLVAAADLCVKQVAEVARSLSKALSTPSEAVQIAVADCLAPLCKVMHFYNGPAVTTTADTLTLHSKHTHVVNVVLVAMAIYRFVCVPNAYYCC
jgi:hypothetical protein